MHNNCHCLHNQGSDDSDNNKSERAVHGGSRAAVSIVANLSATSAWARARARARARGRARVGANADGGNARDGYRGDGDGGRARRALSLRARSDGDSLGGSLGSTALRVDGVGSSESAGESTDRCVTGLGGVTVRGRYGASAGDGRASNISSALSAGDGDIRGSRDGASGGRGGEISSDSGSRDNGDRLGGWLAGAGSAVDGDSVGASQETVEVELTGRVSGLRLGGRASGGAGGGGNGNGDTANTVISALLDAIAVTVLEDQTGDVTSLGRAEDTERGAGGLSSNNVDGGGGRGTSAGGLSVHGDGVGASLQVAEGNGSAGASVGVEGNRGAGSSSNDGDGDVDLVGFVGTLASIAVAIVEDRHNDSAQGRLADGDTSDVLININSTLHNNINSLNAGEAAAVAEGAHWDGDGIRVVGSSAGVVLGVSAHVSGGGVQVESVSVARNVIVGKDDNDSGGSAEVKVQAQSVGVSTVGTVIGGGGLSLAGGHGYGGVGQEESALDESVRERLRAASGLTGDGDIPLSSDNAASGDGAALSTGIENKLVGDGSVVINQNIGRGERDAKRQDNECN